MQKLPDEYRMPLLGAAFATVAGLVIGFGLKAEIAPTSSYGTQLQLSQPVERARTAFDNWFPAEGAPPPVYQTAQLRQDDSGDAAEIDRQIARLLDTRRDQIDRVAYQPSPEPIQPARYEAEPEPYTPSSRGDILASSRYEPPPAEAPRWGWALPGQGAPIPADAPPQIYEDGAAG